METILVRDIGISYGYIGNLPRIAKCSTWSKLLQGGFISGLYRRPVTGLIKGDTRLT